ncbi:MAG: AAA family ATPase, partial [Planctomycetota bacterium]|nr:AAA family ATPase [Planctomycetota bacterium]
MKAVSTAPLAERLRPQSLDEVLGQNQLLGPDSPLRRAFETEEWSSMIFWGPPGTGKTTLALLIAKKADLEFQSFSAVLSGIKDVRNAMEEARRLRESSGRGTLLFVDEIHRFNKA